MKHDKIILAGLTVLFSALILPVHILEDRSNQKEVFHVEVNTIGGENISSQYPDAVKISENQAQELYKSENKFIISTQLYRANPNTKIAKNSELNDSTAKISLEFEKQDDDMAAPSVIQGPWKSTLVFQKLDIEQIIFSKPGGTYIFNTSNMSE